MKHPKNTNLFEAQKNHKIHFMYIYVYLEEGYKSYLPPQYCKYFQTNNFKPWSKYL